MRSLTALPADRIALLALTTLWITIVIAIDPRGDFPLMDDWSYARSVKTLLEEHRLEYDGWASPTLFLHVVYGALFSLPTGFSMTTLRLATLAAALVGIIGTYSVLRQGGATVLVAGLGGLVLMLNPIYIQHAFTFMTDVPFVALEVLSLFFFVRFFKFGRTRDIVGATAIACCATLVRDIGLVLPLAFAAVFVTTRKLDRRTVVIAAVPVLITGAVLVSYNLVIDYLKMTSPLHGAIERQIAMRVETLSVATLVKDAWWVGVAVFSRVALCVMPLLVLLLVPALRSVRGSRKAQILGAVAAALACYASLHVPATAASKIDLFTMWPASLLNGRDSDWLITIPARAQRVVSLLEPAAAALLAALVVIFGFRCSSGPRSAHFRIALVAFALLSCAILLAPLSLYGTYFPRYVLPFLPLMLLCASLTAAPSQGGSAHRIQSAGAIVATALLAAYGTLSVCAAHDYLAWNRARWEAVRYLVEEKGIAPSRIDGGFEATGWYFFATPGPVRERFVNWTTAKSPPPFWANPQAEYLVLFSPRPTRDGANELSEDVIWRSEFRRWLPGPRGAIEVRRNP